MTVSTYIIAEAGVNHNGSLDRARQMVREAAAIGANAIKFQSFQTDEIVIPNTPKANYQNKNSPDSETQYELLKSLELPKEAYLELKKLCDLEGIDFLSTPFDLTSLNYLLDINVESIKISSGDITFGPLLLKAAQSGKHVILSTGMADEIEIRNALAVLAYGYLNPNKDPENFEEILNNFNHSKIACEILYKKVTVLHCTSEYPAPFDELNLRAMQTIQRKFKITVGYSDHSCGILVPCLAVAMGAQIIEKHFTLDCALPGPDHKASLDVVMFSEMIKQIRLTETILGSDIKQPTPVELQNKPVVRRGLYLKRSVKKGELISMDDIQALRPMSNVTPMQYWELDGHMVEHDYEELDAL